MNSPSSLNETNVVCPHCWHNFYQDQAVYISRHPDLFGDPVLGEMENRRYPPHEIQVRGNGDAFDPKGWKMNERGCPRCHLQIPPSLLAHRPFFLSVVGSPRSGKTYFLTSMIHFLRKELVQQFGISLHESDSHEVRAFLEYEKMLFGNPDPNQLTFLQKTQEQGGLYNIVRLDETDVQLPKPFIFSLRPTELNPFAEKLKTRTQRNLVLYDNAGESFDLLKEKAAQIRVTQHLAICDAVLFNFDPLQVPDALARLAARSQDPQVTQLATSCDQALILQEMIHRMRRHRSMAADQIISSDLIVCVQKYDVWKELLPHKKVKAADGGRLDLLDHTSVIFFQDTGVAGLDVEEINRISIIVRALMQDIAPEFVALAESHFGTVRYFPVSALGTSPELEEPQGNVALNPNMLKVRPIRIQPYRVTHPMLWLLRRWGIIKRITTKTDRSNKYPHAEVAQLSSGRWRVRIPQSSTFVVVDREYSESMVVDPSTGATVWIPKLVADAQIKTSNQPQVIAPETPALPKLTISKPKPQPRRGWFKK